MTFSHEPLIRRINEATGFIRTVGVKIEAISPGQVEFSLEEKPELLQFNGYFHGGVVAGLADHAAGAATTTMLPSGKITVTVDLHMNYLAPATGRVVIARARSLQTGSTLCVAAVDVFGQHNGDERLCATALVTLRVVAMPAIELN